MIKGICALSFSPSGKYLVAACIDDNHHIGVFDIESKTTVAFDKSGPNNILSLVMLNDKEFAAAGIKTYL